MSKIIGTITTYHGTEHGYLRGYPVRIIAVCKNAARPDVNRDDDDDAYITDEADLARVGGVTADDRVEVQPWIEKEGRYSFVSSDPLAIDLACFSHLANASEKSGGAPPPRQRMTRKAPRAGLRAAGARKQPTRAR